jgi:hypothetical protein
MDRRDGEPERVKALVEGVDGQQWAAAAKISAKACSRAGREHAEMPDKLGLYGAIAQMGERLLCKQEVAGSIPAGSTGEVPATRRIRTGGSRKDLAA